MKTTLILAFLCLMYGCKKNSVSEKVSNPGIDSTKTIIINSIQTIIDDMVLCGEAQPHGVPLSYDWAKCPRLGYGNNPKHMRAVLPWGQLYTTTKGDNTANTRVQIRNLYIYYLSKTTDQWTFWTGSNSVTGAYYAEDFNNNNSIPAINIRTEPAGGVSVKLVPNYNYHFWSEYGRKTIDPTDIKGVWSCCEARLVIDDPSKPDDRSKAEFILSTGADYWLDLTATWVSTWYNNGDIGIGRFKYVTSDWKAFNMHTLSAQELQANNPPFK